MKKENKQTEDKQNTFALEMNIRLNMKTPLERNETEIS